MKIYNKKIKKINKEILKLLIHNNNQRQMIKNREDQYKLNK